MAQTTRAVLLDALASSYHKLLRRLGRSLGSGDLASEALHETWIDLHKGGAPDSVGNPDAYVFIAALRKGRRLRKVDERYLNMAEISDLLGLADDAPGPDRIAIGRSELAHLHRTLDVLTRRQRAIFTGCYLGEATHGEMAERFNVSIRTVQNELREALTKVTRRMLDKDRFQKPGPHDPNNQDKQEGPDSL